MSAPFTPGMPPAGAAGAFIGRDAQGNVYLLRWHETNGWEALGWVGAGKAAMPALRHPAGQDQGLIVGHVELGIVVDAAALDCWAYQWIGRLRPETDERKTFGDGYFSGAIHVLGELRRKLREVAFGPSPASVVREARARAIYEAMGFAYEGRGIGSRGPFGEWATALKAADAIAALREFGQ